MHHSGYWYGHSHLLARYCGLTGDPPRLPGYLQHGWNVLDGFGTRQTFDRGWPRFVWSEGCRRRGEARGDGDYYVIGAPWNYLMADEPAAGTRREGTIWYPFHGWEYQQVRGDHLGLIEEIREVEPGPVTVCLYWLEYRDEEIRRLYESAGFRVITHGFRGHNYRGADLDFLNRQLAELRAHERVASNRLSTAIFYGIAAGCAPAVYGDPMMLEDADPVFGGVARLERLWPELHGTKIDVVAARAVAAVELGTDYLASPEELRELFRWPLETS
jgi:hypothetical protein